MFKARKKEIASLLSLFKVNLDRYRGCYTVEILSICKTGKAKITLSLTVIIKHVVTFCVNCKYQRR